MSEVPSARGDNRRWMALTGMLVALTVGCALPSGAASAAPANEAAGSFSPSMWAEASDDRSAPTIPSLTNRVGQPDSPSGLLPIGLGLLGLGVLGLLAGIALMRATPLGGTAQLTTRDWRGTERLMTGADMRP